ncbi:MAG: hypothetical protein A2X58_04110 [Nitrospirae bacterium GWC2_56_14]|nr:MAG: hypothetical protein A2X58_04110 [Nitrospirae bacterium GWC2_56_14]
MKRFLFVMSVLMLLILVGCGGGGGGTGAGGAVSGKVPYLVSGPSFTLRSSPTITGKYDVTVTIEADGPTGVYAALVWITDENDWTNATPLDLVNIPGTKRWTGSTYTFLPLDPGQYYVEEIILDDGDQFTANPLGTGWYFVMPPLSTSVYYVDERITTDVDFLYSGGGLSSRPIGRITLP